LEFLRLNTVKGFTLNRIKFLVLDEADRLLSKHFQVCTKETEARGYRDSRGESREARVERREARSERCKKGKGKGREGKGREGKGREGKGREGKGREGRGREGRGREGKEGPVGSGMI
jgi:hypothetical protein